jgi:starvation-inducible DNA-binding protein
MAISENEHSPLLHPTRINIPLEIRVYIIEMLNQTLASTVDLRSQVKQAACNVKGAEFLALQALFTDIAAELDAHADLLAERITVLGGVARATARTAATHSTLPEYPVDLVEGTAHVRELAERFAQYATALRDSIAYATDVEDANTASIYTDISRGIENRLGTLDAHLHR